MAKLRRKRRVVSAEDRRPSVPITKTITSAAVETSGKLYPAKLETDPEVLTGPRTLPSKLKLVETPPAPPPGDSRRNKRKATVSHERIDKIRNVSAYDPTAVSDATLRDDFRILLGWHSKRARDDSFEHSFKTIEAQLRKLLKEAARRGPTAIQFDSRGMSTKVRPVFERLAREVKLPKASRKRFVLKVDTDPGDLTTAELGEAHDMLHAIQVAKSREAWGSESIVNMHARVVDELDARGAEHPSPPNDGLDHSSTEFEQAELEKAQRVYQERTAISRDECSKPMKQIAKVVEKTKPRVAPVRLQKQAERSHNTDSVIVGEFVFQPKPTVGPVQLEEIVKAAGELVVPRPVEKMLELYDERPELFPTVVQKCSGGVRHQIHKTGDTVLVYSEDGDDLTERLPGVVREVQALKAKNLVLDAELETWEGRTRQPHEETIEYLASAGDPDDGDIVANVFDVLYSDAGDIHAWPTVQRLKKLAELDLRKAEHLHVVPAVKVSDLGQLERAARMLGELPGSEGVVAKHVEADYPLVKVAKEWVEFRTDPAQVQEKQVDPFLEIPDEAGAYRYVVQHHWKGKKLHADFRVEFRSGKLLLGWRLQNQIAGVVKVAVTKLSEARAWRPRFDEITKIDWRSGAWGPSSIGAERMAPAPFLWLDVEGKTQDPEEGKAPPVGGSSKFPGVFHIVDQGEVEHGAQKPWLHEYFVRGAAMRYRIVFRQLQIGKLHKMRHAYTKCMRCEKAKPQVDVHWADGRGRAWFCRKCYPIWLKSVGGLKEAEIIGIKAIVGGRAPEKFSDGHKNIDMAKSADPPPGEAEKPLGGPRWVVLHPDDATPHVLSSDAVAKQWMPPAGVSALPKAIRGQVPKDRRYWLQRATSKARKMRDELVAAMAAGDVEFDVDATFAKESKAAAPFVLQAQTWEGAKREVWHLRVDTNDRALLVLTMLADPLENAKVIATASKDPRKASLKAVGPMKPGHYLNPTKSKLSMIEIVDQGVAEILSIDSNYIRLRVKGKRLKGTFAVTRNDNNNWLWVPFNDAKAKIEAEIEKRAIELASRKWFIPIQKIDKDKRLVTGIVLEPGTVDAQNDTITAEVIERASIKFLSGYNSSTQLGVMHKVFGDVGLELAHSWVALANTKISGKVVKKGSWLMTMRVVNEKLWKKVKSKELGGFSIGGLATVAG